MHVVYNQVRVQLSATKFELYERLMEELNTQIYVRTSTAVLNGFQKNGASSIGGGTLPRPTNYDSPSSYLRQPVTRSPDSESVQVTSSEMLALRRLMDVDVTALLTSRPTTGSAGTGLAEPDSDPVLFTRCVLCPQCDILCVFLVNSFLSQNLLNSILALFP